MNLFPPKRAHAHAVKYNLYRSNINNVGRNRTPFSVQCDSDSRVVSTKYRRYAGTNAQQTKSVLHKFQVVFKRYAVLSGLRVGTTAQLTCFGRVAGCHETRNFVQLFHRLGIWKVSRMSFVGMRGLRGSRRFDWRQVAFEDGGICLNVSFRDNVVFRAYEGFRFDVGSV